MGKYVCIYTGQPFEQASHEHIIQASLGARWESDKLICEDMQRLFSGAIDTAVADAVSHLRTFFGTKNGRGVVPATIKDVVGGDGKKYHLQPGMQPVQVEPSYTIVEKDGQIGVVFTMADEKQLAWARAKFLRENPNMKLGDDSVGESSQGQSYLEQPLPFRLQMGGKDFFRGILKSAFNLLGANFPSLAQQSGFDPLKAFVVHGTGDTDPFIRWVTAPDPFDLPRLGEIDHLFAIWARDGEVFGIAQLFGEIPFLLRLGGGIECPEFECGYLVNPLRDTSPAENRSPKIDPGAIPRYEDGPILPGPDVWGAMTARMSRIMQTLQRRGIAERVSQIVDEVLLPHDGKLITAEMVAELQDRMRALLENLLSPE
jgi:hypothetical protein